MSTGFKIVKNGEIGQIINNGTGAIEFYNGATNVAKLDATGKLYLRSSNVNPIGYQVVDVSNNVNLGTGGTWRQQSSIALPANGIYLFSGYYSTLGNGASDCYCALSTSSSVPNSTGSSSGNSSTGNAGNSVVTDANILFYSGFRAGSATNYYNSTTICYVTSYLTTATTIYLHGGGGTAYWEIQATKIA